MERTDLLARLAHDIGLSAWFGGTLMGAAGVNHAAAATSDGGTTSNAATSNAATSNVATANAAWSNWTPVNAGAIALHLLGASALVGANRGRLASQKGVAAMSTSKLAMTGLALGATAYARLLGQRLIAADASIDGGNGSNGSDDAATERAQQQLRALQWAIPVLTGGLIAMGAYLGEQQRPKAVVAGLADGLLHRMHLDGLGDRMHLGS